MNYIIGLIAIVGLMIFWIIIQYVWKNVFKDYQTNEDVLAGRRSCGNCGCGTVCTRKEVKDKIN